MSSVIRFIKACHAGFWLGILPKETLNQITESYYFNKQTYRTTEHNLKDLYSFEASPIERYFKKGQRVLVAAAGGGREMIALSRLGYSVDGFECNPILREYANKLLAQQNLSVRVMASEPDKCPPLTQVYPGILIGNGAYTHIRGTKDRRAFLKALNEGLMEGGVLILSYLNRSGHSKFFDTIWLIGNALKFFTSKDPIERGDTINGCFNHSFTEKEIAVEFEAAGFKLEEIKAKDEVGVAVARTQPL